MARKARSRSVKAVAWKEDELVSRLVPNPARPPQALVIRGFLGRSSEKGCVRIYLSARLWPYVDIPQSEILHVQPIPRELSPLGGSHVWVNQPAMQRSTGAHGGAASPNRAPGSPQPPWKTNIVGEEDASVLGAEIGATLFNLGAEGGPTGPWYAEVMPTTFWGEMQFPSAPVGEAGGGPAGNPFGGF